MPSFCGTLAGADNHSECVMEANYSRPKQTFCIVKSKWNVIKNTRFTIFDTTNVNNNRISFFGKISTAIYLKIQG